MKEMRGVLLVGAARSRRYFLRTAGRVWAQAKKKVPVAEAPLPSGGHR